MSGIEEHERLIKTGLALHEDRQYAKALPVFRQAMKETPECVAAQYNVANTLYMLEQNAEASAILRKLIATNDDTFRRGCPLEEDPAPFKLDALYMLFLTTLYETGTWETAYPFALEHINARVGGIESVFSENYIADGIESLRLQYRP